MRYIADLHVHSKYAGACSEALTLENINNTAKEKGINIIGTGDFTHPSWYAELKSKLEYENGAYKLKNSDSVNFILSSEVCTIFNDGKGFKKIHMCLLAPDLGAVEGINDAIKKFGELKSDGRPILNVKLSELAEIIHGIDKKIFMFPAHAWTPWYGVFGSFGFSSLKDAYEDQAIHIKAIETGLSSDPAMNWRVSALDKVALVSGSDAHSLPKLGREAIILTSEHEPEYGELIRKIEGKKIDMTVEFFPEEGKYHYDGHRNCKVSLTPEQAKKYNGICPVCRKRLTMGVMHRVEELADRKEGFTPKDAVPFVNAVPLIEVIAYLKKKSVASESVKKSYSDLLKELGNEFHILLDSKTDEIGRVDKELALAIENVREKRIRLTPGYDGIFGVVDIMNREAPKKKPGMQSSMSDFR